VVLTVLLSDLLASHLTKRRPIDPADFPQLNSMGCPSPLLRDVAVKRAMSFNGLFAGVPESDEERLVIAAAKGSKSVTYSSATALSACLPGYWIYR
jgi:hypothetical protein